MTHCHNCGHTGTFVLLAQFALAVPGPDAEDAADDAVDDDAVDDDAAADDSAADDAAAHADHAVADRDASDTCRGGVGADDADALDALAADASDAGDASDASNALDAETLSEPDALSLSVQCPACDSTDVGVPASDLLARYGATTTS
jgi:hypothetical protein